MKVLIIGGVAGGASAAARLRRLDESAEIVMLERGEHVSFANCGLPYYIGGVITERSALTLQTPESFRARFRVEVRTCSEAQAIDRGAKMVRVRDLRNGRIYDEPYDKLILSPGAAPIRPELPGAEDPRVFTLRDIPDTLRIKAYLEEKRVRRACVVGGGYIGLEMAENLHRAGVKVTLVEMADHVVAPLDFDMAAELHAHMRAKGVDLRLKQGVAAFRPAGDQLEIELQNGERLGAQMALLAIGVRPESELARACGLELGERGTIAVDRHMRTGDPDIYAVGDAAQVTDFVTGRPAFVPLAGPANKQGRIAADHICGLDSAYAGTQGTAILRCFDMTAACTGIGERAARALGLDCEVVHGYSAVHAGYYPGAGNLCIKLVFQKPEGRLLGAQVVGTDGVDKRCDVLAVAIRAGLRVQDLAGLELAYAPPFSSAKDPVNMAGFMAENVLRGLVGVCHWHQVPRILGQDITWLDVRTAAEFRFGSIEGAVNIPLDELRGRIGELDPQKPVYVNCHSGLRSYIACRILAQKGFECYNLSGGYRLYALCTAPAGR